MFLVLFSLIMTPMLNSWKLFACLTSLILSYLAIKLQFSMFDTKHSQLFSLDLMSSTLIMLSVLITILMMFASNQMNKSEKSLFINLSNLLLLSLILSFSTNNLMIFYIFFEASIIPTFLIISFWGLQPERLSASLYLLFYTLGASLPFLLSLMFLYLDSGSLAFMGLSNPLYSTAPCWAPLFIMAFLVKLPMFMTHLWLPKAHVEAPVAGSMILAAVLLKLGGYGILRMTSLFYTPMKLLTPILISIALIGGTVTSITCLLQVDMKALVAYSSVCHMSFLLMGAMTFSLWGSKGSLSMMISHGLCSSALFFLVTLMYSRTHTRSILLTRGMMSLIPSMMMWWFIMSVNNMAAPPSMNLVSEISLLISGLSWSTLTIIPLSLMAFISAAYSLNLFSLSSHGISWMSSPFHSINTQDHLSVFLHWLPLNILIIKMDLMMTWI